MTKKLMLKGAAALVLAVGILFVYAGCEDLYADRILVPKAKPAIAAAFSNLSADGSAALTTTKLTLTFDKDIDGLTAEDITLMANSTGANKGALTGKGSGVYELTVGGITTGGQVTVGVEKAGYTITPASRQVTIHQYTNPGYTQAAFSNLTQDGSATATTTKLTLVFDKDINGLAAENITLTASGTGANKGTLTRTGTGVYELSVSGITAGGQITVSAAKTGYAITPSSRQVTIYQYTAPTDTAVAFIGLTANGSITVTTTRLTLTFDKDITGLEEADILITAGSTGIIRNGLTRTGAGVYELNVRSIREEGEITVSVSKAGWVIAPPAKQIPIYYAAPIAFNSLTADGSSTAITTKLTMNFDKDIDGLTAEDITLTANSTGATKGTLTKTGTGVYELTVGGITTGGQVAIGVAKTGYAITPASRQVTVYQYTAPGATPVAFSTLTADGFSTATTTKLTLTFDKDITGLGAGDITLTANSTDATKGTLTKTGTGVYELGVSEITSGGEITVSVAKTGYAITPTSKQVTIYQYTVPEDTPAAFSNLTADGSTTATTTTLTLTFDKDISGLTADDITLTANSTGANKGTLTKTGTGVYELTVNGIASGGQITVGITKTGYAITPTAKDVPIFVYAPQGTGGITLGFTDQGEGAFSQGSFTLKKTGTAEEQSKTITVTGTWDALTWIVGVKTVGTGTAFTLNAADYTVGAHVLSVTVRKGSGASAVYWSKELAFTVED